MANETWIDDTTNILQNLSQPSGDKATAPTTVARNRRLTLPEIVFPDAKVHIGLQNGWSFQWTARDVLQDWAEAHSEIPLGSEAAHRGVSVIQTADAALWSSSKKHSATDFHYDWTFSTPFATTNASTTDGNDTMTNDAPYAWEGLTVSGMNFTLLRDTTQPILYFDEIQLYEDDLHDNGVVTFSIKLRWMPTCLYVLSRCWLRVDSVLLRSRETRLMIDWTAPSNVAATKAGRPPAPAVYRDVTWRECKWRDLPRYGLPTEVKAWYTEGGVETGAWNSLLQRIPIVELPHGLPKHSVLRQTSK